MADKDAPLTLEALLEGPFDTTQAIRLLAQKLVLMEQGGTTPKSAPKAQTSKGKTAKAADPEGE